MVTNKESNIRTVVLAVKENYNTVVNLNRYNTGRYIYTIQAEIQNRRVKYKITKESQDNRILGSVIPYNFTYNSFCYDRDVFVMPASMINKIVEFNNEIMRRI